jgi:plasmid maintenance system antidote protein VapI
MELDKKKITDFVIENSSSPGEFLDKYIKMIGVSKKELARRLDSSREYVAMVLSDTNVPEKKACLKIALAVDLDPMTYYRMCSDYKMKQYIESAEFRSFYKEMKKSPETQALMKDLYIAMKKIWTAGRNSAR